MEKELRRIENKIILTSKTIGEAFLEGFILGKKLEKEGINEDKLVFDRINKYVKDAIIDWSDIDECL